jgi:hypothetical protein
MSCAQDCSSINQFITQLVSDNLIFEFNFIYSRCYIYEQYLYFSDMTMSCGGSLFLK